MSPQPTSSPCPCGSGAWYDGCCGPVVRNERLADGAEELMRSRYTAYAVGEVDHVFRTWHPRTRPAQIDPDPDLAWTGLEVLDVVAATGDERTGIVEFRAHWRWHEQTGALHERSRFEVRGGRWVYVEGEVG